MKKILSLALALALVFTLAAPALADEPPEPTTGSTTVTYVVAPGYEIEIPTEVTIPSAPTQEVKIKSGALIPADKLLQFKITASTNYAAVNEVAEAGFKLKNTVGTNIFLTYKITYPDTQTISDLNTVFLSATAAEANVGKAVILSYALTGTATQAGTYTDTLTFTVGYAAAA